MLTDLLTNNKRRSCDHSQGRRFVIDKPFFASVRRTKERGDSLTKAGGCAKIKRDF